MSSPFASRLAPLARVARLTELRLRTREALSSLSFGLVPTLALGTAFVAHVKLTHDAHTWVRMALLGATLVAAALTVGVIVRAYARRYAPHAGALLVDKTHGLSDRLTNALAFAALPDERRTPLMEAAIEDALAHAPQLSATRAVPLSVPRDFAAAAAIGVLLLGLSTLQWSRRELLPIAATIDAVGLSPDDVDLFRDTLRELQKKDQSPETQQALQQFNQLIEDIADKRIDRNEAFKRMEEIERKLAKGQAAEAKALEEALKQMAAEMKKSSLSKPAGEALEKKDFKGAENALKELAKQLRDKQSKISEADKKRLKEALQAAVKKHKESLAKLSEAREQLRASLLQRQQKPEAQRTDEEKKLLQREQRELERLDKEIDQKERAERQLEKLDRELSQAAEDLMKDLGLTADDLEKGAEDLNRMGKEEMSEQEKEELRQRLQELRELLRQEGGGGEKLKKRLRKFAKKAKGGGEQGESGDKGDKGEKKEGEGGEDDDSGEEEDEDGDLRGKKKNSKQGGGQEEGEGEWVMGPGGKKTFRMKSGQGQGQGQGPGQGAGQGAGQGPGQGAGQGAGQGPGQGSGQQPGGGSGKGGKQFGGGHDPNLAGKATGGGFGTQDTQAAASDTGQGPNVSETIHGAAEKGFKGGGYKRVYTDYRTKAEEAMKNEDIPPGYKFYVQRYFQLIRPRE